MRKELTTEASNPASEDLDLLSTIDFVRLVNREDASLARAVAAAEEQATVGVGVIRPGRGWTKACLTC